jgi:L-fuculose-phosphate aldolase
MFGGTTLLNAFDRLEVAEYSAKAIIAARALGEIVAIDGPQVEDLVAAFSLDR